MPLRQQLQESAPAGPLPRPVRGGGPQAGQELQFGRPAGGLGGGEGPPPLPGGAARFPPGWRPQGGGG
eukprot:693732-Prorocentrum_minimum.AAC.1